MSGARRSGLELGRAVLGRSAAIAVAHGRDLDLARLDLLGLRDLQPQDAVLERRGRLVRLQAGRQGHRAAEVAAADLLEDVAALVAGPLVCGLAADPDRAVLQ